MNQLPYELSFMHRLNLHKLSGLLIEDSDITSIARVYGVSKDELQAIEDQFQRSLAELAIELRKREPSAEERSAGSMVAVGDSITSDRLSWVKILGQLWKERMDSRIIDCAISGNTTSDVISRFYPSVLNQTFDRAVLFLGANDCGEIDDEAHLSNVSHEEYARNMRYLVETLQRAGKEIIVVTIPHVDSKRFSAFFPDANQIHRHERVDQANDFLRGLAREKGIGLADLWAALHDGVREVLEEDGIHLNAEGQLVLCEELLKVLTG